MISAFECVHDGWGIAVLVGVPNKDDAFKTHPMNILNERTLKGTFFGNYKPRSDLPSVVERYMNKTSQIKHICFLLCNDGYPVVVTFAQREEWTMLCDTLASKLMTAGNTLAATLCYICAGNIDKTVEIWSRSLRTEHEGKFYVELLQDLMEKTIVLALATGRKRFSASLCKLVEKYAEILASQGLLTTAMVYLKLLGSDELSPELVILRDRIALATEPGM
ncbi:hypothetical protein CMV_022772 [Castanea mollissima]|uniref:Uncharacterized protein n=1 Tax=Castanea mollissima TaxID=60419 RepID=A0A8J4VBA8_9ROSI|nr:hypothetical protein CMV_022772 [Castanea mollissima]